MYQFILVLHDVFDVTENCESRHDDCDQFSNCASQFESCVTKLSKMTEQSQ